MPSVVTDFGKNLVNIGVNTVDTFTLGALPLNKKKKKAAPQAPEVKAPPPPPSPVDAGVLAARNERNRRIRAGGLGRGSVGGKKVKLLGKVGTGVGAGGSLLG